MTPADITAAIDAALVELRRTGHPFSSADVADMASDALWEADMAEHEVDLLWVELDSIVRSRFGVVADHVDLSRMT